MTDSSLRLAGWPGRLASLILLAALAACGGAPSYRVHHHYSAARYYPPPGPRDDPWGPYIHEASGRFGIPELWVRGVMRQESGGQEDVISWAGAMGLMQVMPDTYDDLKGRYSLGDDPFDPHNNILAGTAYLREMYDRFGAPGFLAAYNAGPNRLDRYLNGGTPLPVETVNYVASIAPRLGPGTAMSGPLAVYAWQSSATPSGCDPDTAYDPNGVCGRLPTVAAASTTGCDPDAAYDPTRACVQPTWVRPAASAGGSAGCDPDAAYDPSRPCQPMPATVIAEPLPAPPQPAGGLRPLQEATGFPAGQVAVAAAPLSGRWAVQVGAFANLGAAQAAAEQARLLAPDLLRTAKTELPKTTPLGRQVAFRARLSGLSQSAAGDACARLNTRGTACVPVPPPTDAF
jgi:hypothetical protein